MEQIARRIAEDLLSIRAVFFRPEEPFTWASGTISASTRIRPLMSICQ